MSAVIEIGRLPEPLRSQAIRAVASWLPEPRPTRHLPCGCLAEPAGFVGPSRVAMGRSGVEYCVVCTRRGEP